MRKKILPVLLAVCLLAGMLPLTAGASSGVTLETNGGTITFRGKNELLLASAEGLTGDVVIPEAVNGIPVMGMTFLSDMSGMGDDCYNFTDNAEMTSVTFPKSFRTFTMDMTGDTGDWDADGEDFKPFSGCEALTRIEFSGDGPETLEARIASGAPNLETLVLPRGVKEINPLFCDSPHLQKLALDPENPYFTMDSQGLLYDKKMTRVITAVQGADSRTMVTLPPTVTEIGPYAFRNNRKLVSVEGLSQVKTIGKYAFWNCESLTDIALPQGLETLEESAFLNCKSLERIVMPDGITDTGSGVFQGCTALRDVTLSKNLTVVRGDMFRDCTSLKSIRIPDKVWSIVGEAFFGCSSLKNVEFPKALTRIGEGAFQGAALETLEYPQGITTVKEKAFADCKQLTTVMLPEGVKKIEAGAFSGCEALTSVFIPDSVEDIWDSDYWPGVFQGAPESLVIHGYAGSKADLYAERVGLTFQAAERPALTDVSSHWAKDHIDWAYQKGLMRGVSDRIFAPGHPLDRAMFVTVLHRMEREPDCEQEWLNPFVDGDGYFYSGMVWAWENGIVKGVDNTHFAPRQKITREQLAAFLYRYAGYRQQDTGSKADLGKFPDSGSVSSYAKDALAWAVAEGIVNGRADGKLDPRGNATRAEAAAMLRRFAALQ